MNRTFTDADINKLRVKGLKIIDNRPDPSQDKKKNIRIPRSDCKQVVWMHWNILLWCKENSLKMEKEYRFNKERRWRFDFAIPSLMMGIEYDGLVSEKSGHTTIAGFTDNTEKFNAAAADGWNVYRYTFLNYKNVLQDLNKLMKKKL